MIFSNRNNRLWNCKFDSNDEIVNIKRKTDRFVGYKPKMTILVRLHAPTHAQNECDSINLFCFQSWIVTFQLSNQFLWTGRVCVHFAQNVKLEFLSFLIGRFHNFNDNWRCVWALIWVEKNFISISLGKIAE